QNSGDRDAEEAPENFKIDAQVAGKTGQTLGATAQPVELIENADDAASKGPECGAGHAQTREWAKAEDQTGVENQIDDVRYPEQAHGDSGIAGSAKDGVVEKQHQDGAG